MIKKHYTQVNFNKNTINVEVVSSGSLIKSHNDLNQTSFVSLSASNINTIDFHFPFPFEWSSLCTSFNISEWSGIEYIAIGFISNGNFHHIKIKYPEHGNGVHFSIKKSDLIFVVNKVAPSCYTTQTIRFFIKSTASNYKFNCDIHSLDINFDLESEAPRYLLQTPSESFNHHFISYVKSSVKYNENHVRTAILENKIPLSARQSIGTDIENISHLPNTLQFSYHSLHFVQLLLCLYLERGDEQAFEYAMTLYDNWDRQFYEQNDSSYLWYDHGTAERLMSLCMIVLACTLNGNEKYITKVLPIVISHADLISNPAFYANNQRSKFHNHAWFQDLSLIVTSKFISLEFSQRWLDIGIARLREQLAHLIKKCNNNEEISVFIENSTGYHFGITRIIDCFAELILDIDLDFYNYIKDTVLSLNKFSENVCYTNGQHPAFGDTFRSEPSFYKQSSFLRKNIIDASDAGYLIAQGQHSNSSFQVNFMGSSLSSTHKHEDNLSFTLFIDDIEWLIDPSFYSHEYTKPIPKYLRSAKAHNCLHLKDRAYSIEPGNCKINISHNKNYDFHFVGDHSCYEHATVHREIIGNLDGKVLFIKDKVMTKDCESAYLRLNFNENVSLKQVTDGFIASHRQSNFILKIKMPTRKFNMVTPFDSGDNIEAVSGTGFMSHSKIPCIECTIPTDEECHWTIVVQSK